MYGQPTGTRRTTRESGVPPEPAARRLSFAGGLGNLGGLQRRVGNAAVVGLVQRQVTDLHETVIGVEMTAENMARARRFYATQPSRYPPALIRDIQRAVGARETGVMDDATIKKVAEKQDEFGPPLSADGMAGGRTLARLFPTGLADPGAVSRFVVSVKGQALDAATWTALGTPQARAERLVDLASVQLASARVGVAPQAVAQRRLGVRGLTDHRSWTVYLDVEMNGLDLPVLNDTQAKELATAVYHEARHIEQNYKIARMFATKRLTPDEVIVKMDGLHKDVAKDAREPLARGSTEFLIAEDQAESRFGLGGARHRQVEAESVAAERALGADHSPENQRRREAARAAHDALADETDAIGTEEGVVRGW